MRDPFRLAKFRGCTDLDNGLTQIQSKWDNCSVNIAFTYRFGKTTNQQRRRNMGEDDEINRIKPGGQQ